MKILVVEDEHRIAQSLKKGLELERYTVDLAFTGSQGLDLALTEEYGLIILDLMLPEMDGITICRTLRQEHVHTPILMLTAKGQTEDKITGLDSGADDYLTKPFSFQELLARVRALSRRPKVSQDTVLKVDDLELHPHTYTVKRAGQNLQLSSKEFSLLEYLMRNPNRTLTKQQIISQVWNYEADILPNTVEVYIRNLRNKIDHPFKNLPSLLHTVRGFGYRIGQ